MKKNGILWFLIVLLALAGCLVYFALAGSNLSTKAKLVDLSVKIVERVGIVDG